MGAGREGGPRQARAAGRGPHAGAASGRAPAAARGPVASDVPAIPDAAGPGVAAWLDLLERWNRRVDLVAPGTREAWIEAHVVDAVGALGAVPPGPAQVVDVGSGSGLPGLVWALCRPELTVTLCEPRQRRAAFLRAAARASGAAVSVVEARDDALTRAAFDVAVSRATLPYARWLAAAAPLVRPGGHVIALLGRSTPAGWGEAEAAAGLGVERVHRYRLPSSGAERRAVVLRREP